MAIRFDLVVFGTTDAIADAAEWTNRLASRSCIKPHTVASRTSDLRSYHGVRVPPARAPIQAVVTPRAEKCRAGTTSSTACRDSGAGRLDVCARTGCAVADPIGLTRKLYPSAAPHAVSGCMRLRPACARSWRRGGPRAAEARRRCRRRDVRWHRQPSAKAQKLPRRVASGGPGRRRLRLSNRAQDAGSTSGRGRRRAATLSVL